MDTSLLEQEQQSWKKGRLPKVPKWQQSPSVLQGECVVGLAMGLEVADPR